jgi:hypothetical protein
MLSELQNWIEMFVEMAYTQAKAAAARSEAPDGQITSSYQK